MGKITEKEMEEVRKMAKAEFPDDPALQQVHITREIIAKEAELEGLSFLEYVRSFGKRVGMVYQKHSVEWSVNPTLAPNPENIIMPAKTSGRCIISDPAICHSEPTFRATYASCPADVLEQGASGMAWEAIIERHGRTGRGTAYILKGSNDP